MRTLGYVEGQTVIIERWSGRDHPDHAGLARTIADSRPDVMVARGRTAIRNFRTATTTIPIVGVGTFPADLQQRLARPGGNVTGFSSSVGDSIYQKRVQLLLDAVPTASRIGWIVPRSNWEGTTGAKTREAAEQLGVEFVGAIVESPVAEATIRRAFVDLAKMDVDALVVSNSTQMVGNLRLVVELALASKLPTISTVRQYGELGIMLTYGADYPDLYRSAAGYVDRILKGADPGELPIQLPMRFDFIVNLKTVDALGITLPPKIMIFATEFIE